MDLMPLYKARYADAERKRQSLTERLDQMDQYGADTNPKALKQIMNFSGRPVGADPFAALDSAVAFSENSRASRAATSQDLDRANNESYSMLEALAREQSKGGTSKNQLTAKDILNYKLEAKKNGMEFYVNDKGEPDFRPIEDPSAGFQALQAAEKKDISDYVSFLKDTKRLKESFDKAGAGNTTDIESLTRGTTGPISGGILSNLSGTEDEKQLRKDLNAYTDKIRKGTFGSAFTETEKKVATLPGSKKQEAENRRTLDAFYKEKESQLRSRLKVAGWSDNQINKFVEQELGSGQGAQGVNSDPLGLF